MHTPRSNVPRLLAALALLAAASPAAAQRLGRTYYEDHHNGFQFRFPDDWSNIPPKPNELEAGVVCRLIGDEKVLTIDGRTYTSHPALTVVRITERPEEEGEEQDEDESEGALVSPSGRLDVLPYLRFVDRMLVGFDPSAEPDDEDEVDARRIEGRQRSWELGGSIEVYVDVFSFELEDADIHLVFSVPGDYARKWKRVFRSAARSFEVIERTERLVREEGGTYADELAYHEAIVERTPGWRVVPTPSEKFVVKTSSDDDDFIEEVIERLELSRELFERDFPPSADFDHVSVVRICGSEEEFHRYGGTSRGVGGWFSPSTTELVLFDYKNLDRNATYAVMSHEAFHQYCHFLFDQSEAHRWFDEGHGDYYGGVKFERRGAEVTKKMPAGFDRLPIIKRLVQSDTWVPLEEHLNYTHREWQSHGVASYSQSWSIVYFLAESEGRENHD